MYFEQFGLTVSPFGISPRLDFLYKSGAFEESMAHLVYGLDNSEAIVMITGAIGTGKTMAVQSFLSYLGDRYMSALVTNTCVDGRELLKLILDDLGAPLSPAADKSDLLIAFKKFLMVAGREGKRIVIVIDEAQNLSREVLEEIRLLTNLGQGEEQPVQIILVGQPELEVTVQRPDLAQLKQRIRVHYKLTPLSRREVEEYIDHRMVVAGGKRGVFSARALDRIFEKSGGVPRVVNTLCSEALLSTFVTGRQKVEPSDLDEQVVSVEARQPATQVVRTEARASVVPPKTATVEPRVDMAKRREARRTPPTVTNRSAAVDEPRRRRPWLAAVLVVVAALAALAVAGRLDGLWSRLPFATAGKGGVVGATTELVAAPSRRVTMAQPAAAVADTADSLRSAGDYSNAAADDSLPTVATVPADTTRESVPARPTISAQATAATPTPASNVAGGTVARTAAGPAGDAPPADGGHYIHVSSFRTAAHAASVALRFTESGLNASVREQMVRDQLWHRVYLGPFDTHDDAVRLANRLRDEGTITYYKIIRLDAGEGL